MSASIAKPVQQYGLTEVYSVPNPLVDVVFVHGLNGHPLNTWSTTKPDVFWPSDLLPSALEDQRPRILTYGYDANVTAFTDGVSKDKIHNHAEHLASRLVANRALKRALERPIIFVCHSLGGLVVKRCLIYCHSIRHHQHTERLRSIYVSTYGILFLGTPHNGSDLAKWGSLLEKICSVALPRKFFDSSPQLVKALKANNETLQNINRLFIEIIGRFHIYFFHESKPTDLKGTREFIVAEDSAAPVIEGVDRMGIEKDHSHMCKFEDDSSPGYDVVAEAIQRYSDDSQSRIRSRWEEEKRVSEFERQAAARELLGDSIFQMSAGMSGNVTPVPMNPSNQPTSLSAPPPPKQLPASTSPQYEVEEVEDDFVTVPAKSSFWSVTKFKCVGADSFRLTDSSTGSVQRADQRPLSISTTPLLVAPVGFRPNSMFYGFQLELDQLEQKLANQKRRILGTCAVLLWGSPGSGKSQIAREYLWRHRISYPAGCFWVDCKSKESRSKSYWEIAQAVAILGIDHPRDPDWDECSKFVDSVRKWFENQEGWLLVFDGVTTDNDEDIQAFVPFIPDRAGNNIIYTSVDRTLAKRQRLLNPTGVKVFPLSQHDACSILYKNLGLKEPTPMQAKKAVQLVKHYECLPLAIHAASHMLIARGTSLDKYSPGVSDHRLADPFLDILSALRDHAHPEAVNLVTILSFMAHTVPVALLRFGLPALLEMGLEIRSVESIGSMKKELDNTIAVLIRYGLLERTLLEYSVASPNRSASPEELRHRSSTASIVCSARQLQLVRDDSSSLNGVLDQQGGRTEASSQGSVTYSIDILRIHSVVQGVLRDELRFRYADQPNQYWWWLAAASKFLCHSYLVGDAKIRVSEGRGLVRDYRDYETQAARLRSHFPRSAADAPPNLRKVRHQLHEIIRTIRKEIQNRSPAQSVDSIRHRVQASVFERANSTSSDSLESDGGLTRTSTWTLDNQSESPLQMHRGLEEGGEDSDGSWTDRWSQSGMDHSRILDPTGDTSRRPSESLTTPVESKSRRSSVLQAIFQGRPSQTKKPKDLGEWKPVPAPPTLSHEQVQSRSRASSFTAGLPDDRAVRPTSTSSGASAALAAVHRASPPASRGGRIKSTSRPHSLDRSGSDEARPPLSVKSPNQGLSPLASEFHSSHSLPNFESTEIWRRHTRNPSSSPRLFQAIVANQATSRIIPPLQIEENISITRKKQVQSPSRTVKSPSNLDMADRLSARDPPSGYTSQPMSRDTSRESNISLATAPPAVPGSASLSSSPQIREPYLYSRPGLASIDVVAANAWTDGLEGAFGTARTSPLASSVALEGANIFERHQGRQARVQFGEMSPVEIDLARARATLARERSAGGTNRRPG